ncbi:spore germination protein [Psychrobacillus psychrodurans]|uniref:Spore germination protein n=1 Tax=Psychrobacillus psychrodurans TaxID=126157 RepID=A0A9X3L7E6_9BACI|nr:spore germination protein [Psychrobacillus psychrodurans]MCZ8532540.1 spore germination protein [Psychrobacillus psychrodurans]
MSLFKKKRKITIQPSPPTAAENNNDNVASSNSLKTSLEENLQYIKKTLGKSSDIVIREINIGYEGKIRVGIIYTAGLSNSETLQDFIMETLMIEIKQTDIDSKLTADSPILTLLKDYAITVGEIKDVDNFEQLFTSLLSGDVIVLIEGLSRGLIIGNKHWVSRAVTEPTAQTVIRGPREGFSENLHVNTALVRRIIKDENLWMISKEVGRRTKTNVAIMYINGVAEQNIVDEVCKRINRIDIDGIMESANIEEFIQDSQFTLFPTVYNTERPDTVAAGLLEGRIAILVDGTPFVLLVPALFIQFFQSSEDYYQRAIMASLIRILRFGAFGISILVPALYIALITFHHEIIPPALLISLAAQREGVPFPAFVEAIIMEVTFEILREAGLRMPRAIGSAMSIVGAFVIGTAAVEAGIISASMVIVVSITAISSFVSPTYDVAIAGRILRFIFMGLAASFGSYGILIGLIALVLHLCSLSSFSVPYMSPMAPINATGQKDSIIRFPIWRLLTRPPYISKNSTRQGPTKVNFKSNTHSKRSSNE